MTKDNVLRHSSEFRQRAVDACDELLVQLAAKEARIAVLEREKWIAERALKLASEKDTRGTWPVDQSLEEAECEWEEARPNG